MDHSSPIRYNWLVDWKQNYFTIKIVSFQDEINEIPFFDIELPRELALKIFRHLDVAELCHCAQVNSFHVDIYHIVESRMSLSFRS